MEQVCTESATTVQLKLLISLDDKLSEENAQVHYAQLQININVPLLVDALDGGRIVWMSLSKLPTRESYNNKSKVNMTCYVS